VRRMLMPLMKSFCIRSRSNFLSAEADWRWPFWVFPAFFAFVSAAFFLPCELGLVDRLNELEFVCVHACDVVRVFDSSILSVPSPRIYVEKILSRHSIIRRDIAMHSALYSFAMLSIHYHLLPLHHYVLLMKTSGTGRKVKRITLVRSLLFECLDLAGKKSSLTSKTGAGDLSIQVQSNGRMNLRKHISIGSTGEI
jgi:hypothetical protein